jgi:transposase
MSSRPAAGNRQGSITEQVYERNDQPRPKLGSFIERLSELLKEDTGKPVRHRKSAQILFEQLQREGYEGGYDTVRRYAGTWAREMSYKPETDPVLTQKGRFPMSG